ncbi:MAG: gamma-glutamyl-gamma-aminobutyrate hydrolase family protein, partial [Bacteroidales bacterium]|nr:gamma-glutamyl-gamma-aminobutyrate hydrolase family protein [Bacteroidales bacterium]
MAILPPKIKDIFTECESFKFSQKPVVGVSTNRTEGTSRVADAYINSIINAGGVPLMIPGFANLQLLPQIADLCDAILLTGGGDISPDLLGEEALPEVGTPCEERDRQEIALAYIAMQRQIPLLGICRGHQVINVACGGKNYQDIAKQHSSTPLNHSQEEARNVATHEVKVVKDTLLAKILEEESVMTNSFHHQAIKEVAEGFIANASTIDSVNEGIEKPFYPILGVQWHPEPMAAEMNKKQLAIFEWLVNEAAIYKRAKKFHKTELSIDSHCDTPMFFDEGVNIADNDERV